MNRREFLATSGTTALMGAVAGHGVLPGVLQSGGALPGSVPLRAPRPADYALRIAPVTLELAPGKTVRTIAYNGSVPGPVLRMRQGVPVTVDVLNDTGADEFVHWHGLHIPSAVDGAAQEGTPPVPAHGHVSYTFTPNPPGTRWYHSHTFAGKNFNRSTYTGQFGFLIIDAPGDPGRHDQELFLALHDWGGYITGGDDGFEMVGYRYASINGRLLGFADPIRVREGERVLVRVLNASASEPHWLVLPGHRFSVLALDGNPVPNPASVEQLLLYPGERVDAIVEMNRPGVWILGEPRDDARKAGLGVVVEYAGRQGPPQWVTPAALTWDYLVFARQPDEAPAVADAADIQRIPLTFRSVFRGHGDFEYWSINDKVYPRTDPVALQEGRRYRMVLDNQSTEDHPLHLHRHTFEVTKYAGTVTAGVEKDVVTVPAHGVVEADFTAGAPGTSLFHCHLQDHMDAGFMTVFDCA
jgi:FtsP/CotA-like multicopper oxidase with cupredoxin domain